MSERTEAELARILSGASHTVEASITVARQRAIERAGRQAAAGVAAPDVRELPEVAPPVASMAEVTGTDGDLVATVVLWGPTWDRAALSELCRLLEGRRLFAVEPVPTLGVRRLVQRMLAPLWRRLLGHDFECDVPVELRQAGFQIFAIDRFAVDRLGLRTYAYLELGPRLVPPVR
ncbi:MAG: hypothetical protein AAF962_02635 [Actinomycetota bacterium]